MTRPASALDLESLSEELGFEPAELQRAVDELERTGEGFDGDDERTAELMADWLDDPVKFVRDVFGAEPDEWQKDALHAMVENPRVALKACKGPGKSTAKAWFGWWCLALHVDANGFALSITADNLKDGLWKELALWYAVAPWLQREFKVSAERITHVERVRTWWLSARSFPRDADPSQQANTLAGLHAKFVFILCDESSDYPSGVLAAAEGIFATIDTEAHLVQSGNATRSEGPLYDACTRDRARWVVITVTGDPDDPKRSPRIDIEYAREAIRTWGRDDPWVMTNILGVFPTRQANKLIGPDEMVAAENRDAPATAWKNAAVIWALDVARYGDDDSVLRKRKGPIAFREHRTRNKDGPELANWASAIILRDAEEKEEGRRPDYIIVDLTGVGSSPYDHLKLLGWGERLIGVDHAQSPDEPERYLNKRAEMWHRAARWLLKEGCIPAASRTLARDFTNPTYTIKKVGSRTVMVIESKEELKKRGLPSPDDGDALAMTFYPQTPIRRDWHPDLGSQVSGRALTKYKPLERHRRAS